VTGPERTPDDAAVTNVPAPSAAPHVPTEALPDDGAADAVGPVEVYPYPGGVWRVYRDAEGRQVYEAEGRAAPLPDPRGPPPFDEADLRRALRLTEPPDVADAVAADLAHGGLDAPGTIWVGDILLHVALLSPAHEERMRVWLGVTPEHMAEELRRVRAELDESP
jgi:hypothetical protein